MALMNMRPALTSLVVALAGALGPARADAPGQPRAPAVALDVAEQLVGPVALYPDPLLAVLLPAATSPDDISAAAAFLVQYADPTRIEEQPWDPSVRALAHYPTVLTWMADNIEWTRALGAAFLASPAEVLQAVQRLRARAVASGALASTPRQRVVEVDGAIEILPAEPDAIYAPAYDTGVVYSDEAYSGYEGPYLDFGPALDAGPWLVYDFDWAGGWIWVGGPWHGRDGWHHPRHDHGHAPPDDHPWTPRPPGKGAAQPAPGSHGGVVPLPRPLPGAPASPARPRLTVAPAPQGPNRPAGSPGTAAPASPAPEPTARSPQAPAAPAPKTAAPEPEGPRTAAAAPREAAPSEAAPPAHAADPAAPAPRAPPSRAPPPASAPAPAPAPAAGPEGKSH